MSCVYAYTLINCLKSCHSSWWLWENFGDSIGILFLLMISMEFLSSVPCGLHKVPLLSVISYALLGTDSCVSRVFWSHLMSLHLFPLTDAICLSFPVSSLWATLSDNNHFTPDTLTKFTTKSVWLKKSLTNLKSF